MPDPAPVRCPFCESEHTELIALFGSQLLTSQYRCTACGSYFEGLRPDPRDARVTHGYRPQH
jgi:transposase-like protein